MTRCRSELSQNGPDDEQSDRMMDSEVQPSEVDSTTVEPGEPAKTTEEATCKAEVQRNNAVSALSDLDQAVTAKTEEEMCQAAGSRGNLSSWSHSPARTRLLWKALLAAVVLGLAAVCGTAAMALVLKTLGKDTDDAVCGKEEPNRLSRDLEATRTELDEATEEILRAMEAQRGLQRDLQAAERGLFLVAVLGAAAVVLLLLKQFREAREEAVHARKVQNALAATKIALDEVRERAQATQEKLAATRVELDGVRERAQATQEKLEATREGLERKLAAAAAFIVRAAKAGITKSHAEEALYGAFRYFDCDMPEGTEWHVRSCAMRALGQVVDRGSQQAIAIIRKAMKATKWPLRSCAMKALGEVADRGSPEAMAIVREAMRDTEEHVRLSAMTVLGELADRGSSEAMAIIRAALKDTEKRVRSCAMDTLAKLADRNSPEATAIFREAVKDTNTNARLRAVETLVMVGDLSSPEVVAIIREAMEDTNGRVRRAAEEGLR